MKMRPFSRRYEDSIRCENQLLPCKSSCLCRREDRDGRAETGTYNNETTWFFYNSLIFLEAGCSDAPGLFSLYHCVADRNEKDCFEPCAQSSSLYHHAHVDQQRLPFKIIDGENRPTPIRLVISTHVLLLSLRLPPFPLPPPSLSFCTSKAKRWTCIFLAFARHFLSFCHPVS